MQRQQKSGRKRPTRTKITPQMEESDCGAACLGAILSRHGRHIDSHVLRELSGTGRDGISAATILHTAQRFGLATRAVRIVAAPGDHQSLAKKLTALSYPAITLVDGGHFVVLEGVGKDARVRVNDPARGRHALDFAEFQQRSNGIVLMFEPGSGFEPGGVRRSLRHQVADWFSSCHRRVTAAALALGLIQGLVVVCAVQARKPGMAAGAVAAALLALFLHLLYARLQEGISRELTHRVVNRLAGLPAEFFARRLPSALVTRVRLVDAVAVQLTRRLVPAAVAAVTAAVVLTGTAVTVSPWIAGLFAGSLVAGLLVSRMADRAARDEHRVVAGQFARDAIIGSAFDAPDTLAAEGGGKSLLRALERVQQALLAPQHALYARAQSGLRRVASYDTALSLGVWLVVVWVAARHPGSRDHVTAVLLAAAFLTLQQGVLLRAYVEFKGLRPMLAVLDDILRAPSSPRPGRAEPASSGLPPARVGRIRLRDVSFRYTPAQPVVVQGAALTVGRGETVHVIGTSGSGKSTLARLLTGIVAPSSGTVELDVAQAAYVARSSAFFAGTVADNIALWDPRVSAEDVEDALATVGLLEAVAKRGGPRTALVTADGMNFSGGQRQALALARALARRPDVLVADNATSAMDGDQERRVLSALRERGLTTVCMRADAHLADLADAVYVLEEGRLTPWKAPASL
ncbi:ABC transporter [Streptomyces roseochromogenus]|nr:ABC transporter [Streptomyces roseochromogenus]